MHLSGVLVTQLDEVGNLESFILLAQSDAILRTMGQIDLLEIPVMLHLSKDAKARLDERAAATGKPLPEFISKLVESLVETPRSLAEISGSVYQRFVESGTTDDQLSAELEQAKHDMRAERQARQAS